MRNIILFFLTVTVFLACSNSEKAKPEIADQNATIESKKEPHSTSKIDYSNHEIKTKSNVSYLIQEQKLSESLSNIRISGKNFEHNPTIVLNETDPLESTVLADLNEDGFSEIYLITRSIGSGSYAKLYGFASYKDKSFGEIYIQDIQKLEKEVVNGYRGHDSIYLINNKMYRSFPSYNLTDKNAQSNGAKIDLSFQLVAGEAGYLLKHIVDGM